MSCFLTALSFLMPLAIGWALLSSGGPVAGPHLNRADRKCGHFCGALALVGATQLILRIERDRLRKSARRRFQMAGACLRLGSPGPVTRIIVPLLLDSHISRRLYLNQYPSGYQLQMPNSHDVLFRTLADPTRRAILVMTPSINEEEKRA
jgi:hypothetical protein